MIALEIHVNGKKQCTAGFADGGVATAIVSCVLRLDEKRDLPKEQANLHVSGLDSQRHEHVAWLQEDALAVGDEVVLRVVDAQSVDAPLDGTRRPRDEQRHKDYVLKLAKQFGWKVDTTP